MAFTLGGMSLSNEELETQIAQLAEALAKATDLTTNALLERDKKLAELQSRIEALEAGRN